MVLCSCTSGLGAMGLSSEDPLTLPPGLRPLARVVCLLFCKEMGGAPSQHGCNDQMSQPSPAPGIRARSLRRSGVIITPPLSTRRNRGSASRWQCWDLNPDLHCSVRTVGRRLAGEPGRGPVPASSGSAILHLPVPTAADQNLMSLSEPPQLPEESGSCPLPWGIPERPCTSLCPCLTELAVA